MIKFNEYLAILNLAMILCLIFSWARPDRALSFWLFIVFKYGSLTIGFIGLTYYLFCIGD